MKKSEKIDALAGALAKAQGQFPPIERAAKVDFMTKSGAKIKYSYAPLPDIIKLCKKPLAENELCVMQHIWTRGDDKVVIETVLAHSSGEWVSSSFSMVGEAKDPQGMGSLITYGRRYGLSSVLNISADEDDDAVSHMKGDEKKPEPKGHYCTEHKTVFFMKGKMKNYAHPIKDKNGKDTGEWCHEHKEEPKPAKEPLEDSQAEGAIEAVKPKNDMDWLKESLDTLGWVDVGGYLRRVYKVSGTRVSDMVEKLSPERADEFFKEVEERLAMKEAPERKLQEHIGDEDIPY